MEEKQKVLLVGVNLNDEFYFFKSMSELEELVKACQMLPIGSVVQNLKEINSAFYVGSGKLEEIKDSLNIALEIINTLLQNKEIKKSENTELYQQYVGNDEVESLCDMISEKMGFNIYRLDNTLNLCVMLDNKVFGYSNEDLKKKIKILNKNEDIYLMYFIILTIITCFYRESGLNSPRSYLGLDELIETINIKFQSLVKEDIEKISEENEYNFRDVKKVWERLPDAREDINSGKNDKISFVKLVLNFMQEENLIFFDEERRIISITTRFKSIVYFYFEYSKENKNRLLEYVYELGGNENATY